MTFIIFQISNNETEQINSSSCIQDESGLNNGIEVNIQLKKTSNKNTEVIYPWVEHVIIRLWVISMSMVIIFLGVKYNYKGAYYYFYFVVLCHVCRPLPARLF